MKLLKSVNNVHSFALGVQGRIVGAWSWPAYGESIPLCYCYQGGTMDYTNIMFKVLFPVYQYMPNYTEKERII